MLKRDTYLNTIKKSSANHDTRSEGYNMNREPSSMAIDLTLNNSQGQINRNEAQYLTQRRQPGYSESQQRSHYVTKASPLISNSSRNDQATRKAQMNSNRNDKQNGSGSVNSGQMHSRPIRVVDHGSVEPFSVNSGDRQQMKYSLIQQHETPIHERFYASE